MLGHTGFYCFTHQVTTTSGLNRRYAFAYKPPGPVRRGDIEELILRMCKGPNLPDVVVVIGLDEEPGEHLFDLLIAPPGKVAQERLKSRIPLVFAKLSLLKGVCSATLLDSSFRRKFAELRAVIEKDLSRWLNAGLQSVFDPKEVLLRAPPGYAYQKPSGARSEIFLRPDLALKSSASVGFVALALFYKVFSGQKRDFSELQTVFVDTMAIAPVAYALRDLLTLCGFDKPYHIESFHSYGGFEEVIRPLRRTSLCLISASSSMELHKKWILKKEVTPDEVVTLLTLSSAVTHKDGALYTIQLENNGLSEGTPQLSIRISGETFLPEQEPAKKILLNDSNHRSNDDVAHFFLFAGTGVFDVYRRPPRSSAKARALFVNGLKLLEQSNFVEWLHQRLISSVKASTKTLVYQNDESSKILANLVANQCQKIGLDRPSIVSSHELRDTNLGQESGVIVCAAVIGKGSQLLEVSRTLRDKHEGPRLYVVGYQVAESRGELASLESNLKHSKGVPHEVARYGRAATGTQLGASFKSEIEAFYPPSLDNKGLPGLLKRRAPMLGGASPIGKLSLLPHGEKVDKVMNLRAGFAYWPEGYVSQPCHAEVLATVAVLLQRARELESLPEEKRLATASFRHVVLAPENFARFNDGVIQAALLRCAYPSELDFRGDHGASDFMKSVILRALSRATEDSGEGILEFLIALEQRRLQLSAMHHEEVKAAAQATSGRPRELQKAIDFIFKKPGVTKNQLPF